MAAFWSALCEFQSPDLWAWWRGRRGDGNKTTKDAAGIKGEHKEIEDTKKACQRRACPVGAGEVVDKRHIRCGAHGKIFGTGLRPCLNGGVRPLSGHKNRPPIGHTRSRRSVWPIGILSFPLRLFLEDRSAMQQPVLPTVLPVRRKALSRYYSRKLPATAPPPSPPHFPCRICRSTQLRGAMAPRQRAVAVGPGIKPRRPRVMRALRTRTTKILVSMRANCEKESLACEPFKLFRPPQRIAEASGVSAATFSRLTR